LTVVDKERGIDIMFIFYAIRNGNASIKWYIPKGRKKELYGKIRKFLGPVFHELARQKRGQIEAGHMLIDHVHILINIPPKYAVSTVGFEEEKMRHYIRQQEQFDKKDYDEPDPEKADDEIYDHGTF
jgi:REP element-mobilizing transposase RayT